MYVESAYKVDHRIKTPLCESSCVNQKMVGANFLRGLSSCGFLYAVILILDIYENFVARMPAVKGVRLPHTDKKNRIKKMQIKTEMLLTKN